jgi:hypothetical protein
MSCFRENVASPAALAKRREALAQNARMLREAIIGDYRRGLVPLAIATRRNFSVRCVSEALREAGVEIPAYLSTS